MTVPNPAVENAIADAETLNAIGNAFEFLDGSEAGKDQK